MGLYPMTHPVRGMLPLRRVRLQASRAERFGAANPESEGPLAVVSRLQREGSSLSHALFLGRCPQAMLSEPFGLVLRVPAPPTVAVNGPRHHPGANGLPDPGSWSGGG